MARTLASSPRSAEQRAAPRDAKLAPPPGLASGLIPETVTIELFSQTARARKILDRAPEHIPWNAPLQVERDGRVVMMFFEHTRREAIARVLHGLATPVTTASASAELGAYSSPTTRRSGRFSSASRIAACHFARQVLEAVRLEQRLVELAPLPVAMSPSGG